MPYLWEPGDTAVAGGRWAAEVEDEVIEVEGSRASLSPADVRSAMPRRPTTPSGGQRAGAGRRGSGRRERRGRSWLLSWGRDQGGREEWMGEGRLAGRRAMLGRMAKGRVWCTDMWEREREISRMVVGRCQLAVRR